MATSSKQAGKNTGQKDVQPANDKLILQRSLSVDGILEGKTVLHGVMLSRNSSREQKINSRTKILQSQLTLRIAITKASFH
jgi:hypothetical protein